MDILDIVAVGFLVSVGTFIFIGKKACKRPGGSLSAGILIAYSIDFNLFLGAILGVLGWVLFLMLVALSEK